MITYNIVTSYRITCHEANRYFKLCRDKDEKPTIPGLMDYVRARRA